MSSTPPRWVVVDDENPLIHYQGPWSLGNSSNSYDPIFGEPFDNTLHVLSANGDFTFNFRGSSVSVIGSFSNIETSTAPSWSCMINGFALPSSKIPGLNRNAWEICGLQDISTTTSTKLTVTASGTTDSPFLLDRIEYIPDTSVSLDDVTVVVDANDTQIRYGSGWSSFRDIGMETSVNGSTMALDFNGTQVTWITAIPSNANITVNSTARYRIDGTTFIPFQVAASTSVLDVFNQVSFQTPRLPRGSHRLDIQHQGNDSTAPLILDRLVIQNHTDPPPHRLGAGAIAGIVIGSFAGLAFIIIFGWFAYGKWEQAEEPRVMTNGQERVGHNQDGAD